MDKRQVLWERIILAFLIANLLFFMGLLFGYVLKNLFEGSTITLEDDIRHEILNLETIQALAKDNPCDFFISDLVAGKLDALGEYISVLEKKKGKNHPDVLEMKEFYTILEIRHMLLVEEKKEKCGEDTKTILFFYSNNGLCESDSERTGFILSYVRKNNDFVRVYSFDVDLNSDIVHFLKNKYNITSCPEVLFVEDNITLTKIENAEEIEKYL